MEERWLVKFGLQTDCTTMDSKFIQVGSFKVYITRENVAECLTITNCRGRAVKSTEFKLWCFWSAECGFESQAVTLVSLSKTFNHCFVLRMEHKAVGPMCCVTHVKEPSALIEKRRGSPRCSWLWLLNAPYHLVNLVVVVVVVVVIRCYNGSQNS